MQYRDGRTVRGLRVDGADHACLAMLALRAVVPHWLCVLDADGVGQDARAGGVGDGHEAGEEGVGLVGHDVCDGDARVVEGGLYDGVVLCLMLAREQGSHTLSGIPLD
jgi:hypothetical protein